MSDAPAFTPKPVLAREKRNPENRRREGLWKAAWFLFLFHAGAQALTVTSTPLTAVDEESAYETNLTADGTALTWKIGPHCISRNWWNGRSEGTRRHPVH